MNFSPLIHAFGQHDIAVTGEGVLDGQASTANWWSYKPRENNDFNALEAMADAGIPPQRRVFGHGFHLPPPFFQPYRCENVLVEGVTCAPGWQIAGYSADPVGGVHLSNVAITSMTGRNTARHISSFTLDHVTVGGVPVSS